VVQDGSEQVTDDLGLILRSVGQRDRAERAADDVCPSWSLLTVVIISNIINYKLP
jgi:hypothetical protein